MQMIPVPRIALIEACLALSLYRARPGSHDKRDPARRNAQQLLHGALHAESGDPAAHKPESPLNLLRAVLDYCEAEGVPHREIVAVVNSHARQGLPRRHAGTGQEQAA